MIIRIIPKKMEDVKKVSLKNKLHRKAEEIKFKIIYWLSCKHDYQAIRIIDILESAYGEKRYVYQLQCIKCGRRPLLCRAFKEKQATVLPYEYQNALSKLRKGDLLEIRTYDNQNYTLWFCKRKEGNLYGLETESRAVIIIAENNIASLEKNKDFKNYMMHVDSIITSNEFKECLERKEENQ